jgi:uncharacterized protein
MATIRTRMSDPRKFEWYQLRTTDVAAAGEFYASLLGFEVRNSTSGAMLYMENDAVAEISVLPERARLRGAPSHWVGYIGVPDVEDSARLLVERGAERLPVPPAGGSSALAILRDPLGAIVGLRSPPRAPARRAVALHQSFAPNSEAAWSLYSELFGWSRAATPLLSPEAGPSQSFAWDATGQAVGAMLSNADSPHIHVQWLYYFGVPSLARALDTVLGRGGKVAASSYTLASGARIAVCDDPQGAAFALLEPATA